MKETKIANRYAKALFELTIEMDQLEKTKADAQLVYDVCKQNRDLILMFRSPVIKPTKKIAILKEVFEKKLIH
ncbi:MAG: F0F1 ATP synthase subunit delta [Bacteroidales bacterium]